MLRKFTSLIFVFATILLCGCNNIANIDTSEYDYYYDSLKVEGDFVIGEESGDTGILADYIGDDIDIIIPEGIKYIEDRAFRGSDIRSIVIHKDVVEIDMFAFADCKSLESVVFKGGTDIDSHAFENCVKLSSVIFSERGEENDYFSIESGAFYGCTSLEKIKIPCNLATASGRDMTGIFENSGLKNVEFEKGVHRIVEELFWNAKSLKSVTFPESVNFVGEYAFAYSGLENIYIRNMDLDVGAFIGCENLKSVTLLDHGYADIYDEKAFIGEGETAEDIKAIFYVEEGSECEKYVKGLGLKHSIIEDFE